MSNETIKSYFLSLSKNLWDMAIVILIAAAIVFPIRKFIFQPFIVSGSSMEPTYYTGDYLIIDELSYRFNEPAREDVIVFSYPQNPEQKFIKRIIGLPGETVEIKGGKVFIEQGDKRFELQELYLPSSILTIDERRMTLNQGEYFVMGDNRMASYDSRKWGSLPKDKIIGKVLIKVFSPKKIFGANLSGLIK
ncbi:MAG TPA: signal peptidase I [Candidatus Pacearchaeota archaeon]|nr:signal peptidase I [Candidatus Pacearchaeota archaeon]HPM08420.1 signal peptidase I [Candidatus Pacearchaeota archaeon]